MKKLMIIDGSSLLFRAFFALPPLKSALGTPTNAVYGFLTMLIKLYEEIHPDYIAVAFDKGRQTFRTEMYSEYKGNRPDAPEDLRPQFSLIQDVLKAMGICVIEEEGFEGDDILGSLSKKFASSELAVQIITGDRDNLQLVSDCSHVFLTKKGISDMLEITLENMQDLYGYGPDKVIQMKALMGDSSDNIPGVPGVGEKTAFKLISEYGDLESIYENIDTISGKKLKERLLENKELAFLSRDLATIKTDMDFSYELDDFVQQFHLSEVKPMFESLGFTKLTPRLAQIMGTDDGFEDMGGLFAVQEEVSLDELVDGTALTESFYEGKTIAVHVVLSGHAPFRSIVNIYLSNGDVVVKTDGSDIDLLTHVLNGAAIVVTTQAKELLEVLGTDAPADIRLFNDNGEARIHDVSLMAYLLDPTRTNYGYLYLTERFSVSSIATGSVDVECVSMVKALLAMNNAALDTIRSNDLWNLYNAIELPLIHTLLVMEKNGIYIDPDKLADTTVRFKTELELVQQEIYKIAGETFNINSPKQLGIILFEKMNLPVIKKTKTGYSTDAEVLDMLRNESPIVEKILQYRTIAKLVSTYLEGLAVLINPNTHRIHTTFNQMVTATGRLSSSEPNLQNIPVRTEKGREIRALFYPGEGFDTLVSADYSQIELRILAHLSGDKALIKAFTEGKDIHRFTAAEVLGKAQEEITSEERSHAKAINFGIIYGISDFGLSRDLGITRAEAKNYIDLYFSRYPRVKEYMDNMVKEAHETGKVRTMFGRLRELPDINSRNFNRRSFAERTAMNTPIQGTAADIIKLAMNKVESLLEEKGFTSRLLLQVHDELVLEVINDELEAVKALLKETMECVVDLQVPLIVDVHDAENWALVK
ncbi:DNA polymerase I [Veillonella caviae]|uniref:DNA polymerase I n=1 Tax=Veillonella caviae TaxID=248316 RepID=UPI0023A79FF5|nr:DNA polymerase I [Veillonella caviae]MCI5708464.1 DNA polymerase I [Veillonella caviae]MDD7290624.1 DNA polymerase I [Veillonella caviae]MDY5715088.1 DNA polymerase I [Veillonella caviae]